MYIDDQKIKMVINVRQQYGEKISTPKIGVLLQSAIYGDQVLVDFEGVEFISRSALLSLVQAKKTNDKLVYINFAATVKNYYSIVEGSMGSRPVSKLVLKKAVL